MIQGRVAEKQTQMCEFSIAIQGSKQFESQNLILLGFPSAGKVFPSAGMVFPSAG